MDNAFTTLKVWFTFDEETEVSRAVAAASRLQASIYLGADLWAIAAERREPAETLCLANPGVVFVETEAFSRVYKAQDQQAQRGAA